MDQPKKILTDAEMNSSEGPKKILSDEEMNAAPGNPVGAIGHMPQSPEGGTPENPAPADLYGDEYRRFKSSFGDVKGNANAIESQGYKNVHQNKNGELVAQWPGTGLWHKDLQGISHPLNWAAGHAGQALPLGGQAVGAVLGGMAGLPEGGVGAIPAGVAAGAAGSGIGEGARAAIGKLYGTNTGDITPQMEEGAKEGAINETIGKTGGYLLGKLPGAITEPVTNAANYVANKTLRPTAAALSKMISLGGVDYDAAMALLKRPKQVMSSLEKGNVSSTAMKAGSEYEGTRRMESELASKGKQKFADMFGAQQPETTGIVNDIQNTLDKNAPNQFGESGMSDAGREYLQQKKVSLGYDDVAQNGSGTSTSATTNELPKYRQSAASLQKTAEDLQNEASGFYGKSTAAKLKTDKEAGQASLIAGKIKGLLHQMDPNGLGASDARFSQFAARAPMFSGLENPSTAEGWASNLFGKNKTAFQEAAKKDLPKTYENLADIGAYKKFGEGDVLPSILGPTGRAVTLLGVGEGLNHMSGNPLGTMGQIGLGGWALASHPKIQRQLLNIGGRAINQEIPSMAAQAINPWANYKESNK